MSLKNKIAVMALITTGAVALTSCGYGSSAELGRGAQLGEASSQITTPQAVPAAHELPDPLSLRGPSVAADIGEIIPITTNPQPQLPVSFTDADGHQVEVTDVSRIIPLDLYGTYSRVIEGLGLVDNIVGRAVSSNEKALEHVPLVTKDGHSINVEAVLQLQPTLVIVDHSVGPLEAIEQLRAAGVTVAMLDPQRTLESVGSDIQLVANCLGLKDEGKRLAERSTKQLEVDQAALAKMIPADSPRRPRMAFLYVRGNGGVFFIMGNGYGAEVLIDAVGGDNVGKNIDGVRPANAESLAELNPEIILVMSKGLESTGGVDGLLQRPGVAQTIAGQNRRIVAIPDGQSLSFGPQAGAQLVATAKAIYAPE